MPYIIVGIVGDNSMKRIDGIIYTDMISAYQQAHKILASGKTDFKKLSIEELNNDENINVT